MNNRQAQRKPEEIESDINQHRERLDEALEAMEERLSPQRLLDATFDYIRHGGANVFASNLSDTIKQNPAPFLVTSVGLGWLVWSQRKTKRSRSSSVASRDFEAHSPAAPEVTTGFSRYESSHDRGRMHAAKEKAHHLSDDIKERAQDLSSKCRNTARGTGSRLRGISGRAQGASQQTVEFIEDHPVMAGAMGIAIGAAIGSLLPSTRAEDERMGALRDKTLDRATEEGERYVDEARSKVHEKAEQTHSERNDSQGSMESHVASGAQQASGASASGASDTTTTAGGSDRTQTAVPPTATTPGSAKEATEPNGRRTATGNPAQDAGMHSDDPRADGNER